MRLTSDPNAGPVIEANLVRENGSDAVEQFILPSGAQHRLYGRPDGGRLLTRYPLLSDLPVRFNGISLETRDRLRELEGRIDRGRDLGLVYIDPPFRPSTIVSCPLQTGLGGWKRDESDGTLSWADDAVTFTRASAAYAKNADGEYFSVANDVPRFESNQLGSGMRLERGLQNYCSPAHPSSGSLGWSASIGTATFRSGVRSHVLGKTGVLLAQNLTSDCSLYRVLTFSGVAGDRIRFSVWCRSSSEIKLLVSAGGGAGQTIIPASDGRDWVRVSTKFTATTSFTSVAVLVYFQSPGGTACTEGEIGGSRVSHSTYSVPLFNYAEGTPASDSAIVDFPWSATALTISGSFILPPESGTEGEFFKFRNASGNITPRCYVSIGGQVHLGYTLAGTELITTGTAINMATYANRRCVLTAWIAQGRAKTRLTIAAADGRDVQVLKTASISSTSTLSLVDVRGLQLAPTYAGAGSTLPGWLEVAGGWLDESEIIERERSLLLPGEWDLYSRVVGRGFLLSDLEYESEPSRPDHFNGSFSLTEMARQTGAEAAA